MLLPASIMRRTESGATSGGTAIPLASAVAWLTEPVPPSVLACRGVPEVAGPVGAGPASASPGSLVGDVALGAGELLAPALGCTTCGRSLEGSGGRPESVASGATAALGTGRATDRAATAVWSSEPDEPSTNHPPPRRAP